MRTLYFDFCVGVVIEMSNMTQSPVKDGKAVTRKINDTSFEEGEAGASKVQRFEEAADSPPWALLLQKMDEVKAETRATNERVDALAKNEKKAKDAFKAALQFFGERPTTTPKEFFDTYVVFIRNFKR